MEIYEDYPPQGPSGARREDEFSGDFCYKSATGLSVTQLVNEIQVISST